jgi:peptidoglycan biosynthesis protein MviN/MurJ (putative lipid II flippase)
MKSKALGGKSAIILLSHSTISFALITISARRYHSQQRIRAPARCGSAGWAAP